MPRREGDAVIVPYAVRIERSMNYRHDTTDDPILSNFDGNGTDLLRCLSAYFRGLPGDSMIEDDTEHFGIATEMVGRGRTLQLAMNGGHSGHSARLKLEPDDIERELTTQGVQWNSFGLVVVVPQNTYSGWMFVEKNGRHTIPVAWRDDMVRQFREHHPGFKLVISQVRTAGLWAEVEEDDDVARVLSVSVEKRGDDEKFTIDAQRGSQISVGTTNRKIFSRPEAMNGSALRGIRRRFTKTTRSGTEEINLSLDVNDLDQTKYAVTLAEGVLELKARLLTAEGHEKTVIFNSGREPHETYPVDGVPAGRLSAERMRTESLRHARDLAKSTSVSLAADFATAEWDTEAELPAWERHSEGADDAEEADSV